MSEPHIEYLDLDDLLALATALLGEPPPVRDLGMLGAAVARPSASAFGEEAYTDVWSKAAALLHSVVGNHALVDGNKRLGWVACAVFLDINGVDPSSATNDAVFSLVMRVASEQIDVGELAGLLRSAIERDHDDHECPPGTKTAAEPTTGPVSDVERAGHGAEGGP